MEEYKLLRSLQEDYKGKLEIIEVVETKKYGGGADVPFADIDEVPVFPGCEELETNHAKKDYMAPMMNELAQDNFNTGIGKELGLTVLNRS